jgi:Tfp pilus assembly PilM family ATPase
MPRILAIDWDRHEARALLVVSGPTGTNVAGAWAVPLTTTDMAGLSGKQIGARLASAISEQAGGKTTTIVGAGRDHVQMKLLTLPPAPADELPDMVRFQAEREFTALGTEAALDYIPLAGDSQTPHQVLAIALSPAGVTEVRELCEPLGLEPDRIAIRACAAGALVHRSGVIDAGKVALVVNPLTDEADLTVQSGEQVFLMRTVRLPEASHGEGRQRALLGEIRRTVAAARQQLMDRQVEQVVVCGNSSTAGQINGLTEELGMPVTLFDPATSAPSNMSAAVIPPESLARFSAVLGMALGEADRRPPIVDFINVRRKAEPRQFTRVHALAAAAAGIAVLAFIGSMWLKSARTASQLAEVRAEIASLAQSRKQFDPVVTSADAVERWLATDVNWLDELEGFARRVRPKTFAEKDYPVNEDVVVTQLTMVRPQGSRPEGGRMGLQAVAKTQAAVPSLESRLSDAEHRVDAGSVQQDTTTVPGYKWGFNLDVHVKKMDDEGGVAKP